MKNFIDKLFEETPGCFVLIAMVVCFLALCDVLSHVIDAIK